MFKVRLWFENILSLLIAGLLGQSLFFKFSDAPETHFIFGTLDKWAAEEFGVAGLFNPSGIFSAKVVGSFELVASLFLVASFFFYKPYLRFLGAFISANVIAGALFFHLCTPLGIVVQDDGGLLFGMACLIFLLSVLLLTLNFKVVWPLFSRLKSL